LSYKFHIEIVSLWFPLSFTKAAPAPCVLVSKLADALAWAV